MHLLIISWREWRLHNYTNTVISGMLDDAKWFFDARWCQCFSCSMHLLCIFQIQVHCKHNKRCTCIHWCRTEIHVGSMVAFSECTWFWTQEFWILLLPCDVLFYFGNILYHLRKIWPRLQDPFIVQVVMADILFDHFISEGSNKLY